MTSLGTATHLFNDILYERRGKDRKEEGGEKKIKERETDRQTENVRNKRRQRQRQRPLFFSYINLSS
jgi:hypothetical protein